MSANVQQNLRNLGANSKGFADAIEVHILLFIILT